MAVRNDLTVNWLASPRIITIAEPSTEITIQDLVDTLRVIEDDLLPSMAHPFLIEAAGKEDLGGGTQVGITAELQNAVLAFEPRITPSSTGTHDGANDSVNLIDSTADFVTDLVMPGSLVINWTDRGISDVSTVESATELETNMMGGTDNDWDFGDEYGVYNIAQGSVIGGNLVAVDDLGAQISPILPTFGVSVDRAASSSATIVGLGSVTGLTQLIFAKVMTL